MGSENVEKGVTCMGVLYLLLQVRFACDYYTLPSSGISQWDPVQVWAPTIFVCCLSVVTMICSCCIGCRSRY